MHYKYEGIYGYEFFKRMGESACLNNLLHANIFKGVRYIEATIDFLNGLNKGYPLCIFAVEDSHTYAINEIIDGYRRLQMLAQVFVEPKYRKDFEVVYDALKNEFVARASFREDTYELYDVYDTFHLVTKLDELKKSDKYTEEQKKIMHDNLVNANKLFQDLVFYVLWITFDKDDAGYQKNFARKMLNIRG